jgi:hypothetical protein
MMQESKEIIYNIKKEWRIDKKNLRYNIERGKWVELPKTPGAWGGKRFIYIVHRLPESRTHACFAHTCILRGRTYFILDESRSKVVVNEGEQDSEGQTWKNWSQRYIQNLIEISWIKVENISSMIKRDVLLLLYLAVCLSIFLWGCIF